VLLFGLLPITVSTKWEARVQRNHFICLPISQILMSPVCLSVCLSVYISLFPSLFISAHPLVTLMSLKQTGGLKVLWQQSNGDTTGNPETDPSTGKDLQTCQKWGYKPNPQFWRVKPFEICQYNGHVEISCRVRPKSGFGFGPDISQ
jgi:hypothetical protein